MFIFHFVPYVLQIMILELYLLQESLIALEKIRLPVRWFPTLGGTRAYRPISPVYIFDFIILRLLLGFKLSIHHLVHSQFFFGFTVDEVWKHRGKVICERYLFVAICVDTAHYCIDIIFTYVERFRRLLCCLVSPMGCQNSFELLSC